MTAEQELLWQKINGFQLDDPAVSFSFTDRLAQENAWELDFALRCVTEYKRFMLLLCISEGPLTPSEAVDQVWHLHLLYTASYWIDFCQGLLGRMIHHGPTRGGPVERDRFTNWYENTISLYHTVFEREAPADIWPSAAVRFAATRFQRINTDDYWLIPKPKLKRK